MIAWFLQWLNHPIYVNIICQQGPLLLWISINCFVSRASQAPESLAGGPERNPTSGSTDFSKPSARETLPRSNLPNTSPPVKRWRSRSSTRPSWTRGVCRSSSEKCGSWRPWTTQILWSCIRSVETRGKGLVCITQFICAAGYRDRKDFIFGDGVRQRWRGLRLLSSSRQNEGERGES